MCTLSLWRVFLFWKDIKVGVGVVPPAPQVRTQEVMLEKHLLQGR